MKIALIGPGIMPIPPNGWGGVENTIWKYYLKFVDLGHEVVIFNSKNIKKVSLIINSSDFDFVHIHHDEYVKFFSNKLRIPFCATSHYGLILQKNEWSNGYFSIFSNFFSCSGIISLSNEIRDLYLKNGYSGPIYVLKNGINVDDFSFKDIGNNRAICLGKIEKRKRQSEISKILDNNVNIDFVGPVSDNSFKEGNTTRYLGSWSRELIEKKLTDYNTLVLLSRGEAAPAVVVEALASGLSLVISKSASANLEKHPFITVLDDEEDDPNVIISAINNSIRQNNEYRKLIREYASNNFDNSMIMREYLDIINNFIGKKKEIKMPRPKINSFIKNNLLLYIYSSFWLSLSKIKIIRFFYNFLKNGEK